MNKENEKPIKRFRRGGVEAAIWKQQTEDRLSFTVQLNKRFRDKAGEYRNTTVFLGADMLKVERVAELADNWIHDQLETARGNDA